MVGIKTGHPVKRQKIIFSHQLQLCGKKKELHLTGKKVYNIMENWIPSTLSLSGQVVDLFPLQKEHFPELLKLAAEKRIWEFYIFDGTDAQKFSSSLHVALAEKEKGTQFP